MTNLHGPLSHISYTEHIIQVTHILPMAKLCGATFNLRSVKKATNSIEKEKAPFLYDILFLSVFKDRANPWTNILERFPPFSPQKIFFFIFSETNM